MSKNRKTKSNKAKRVIQANELEQTAIQKQTELGRGQIKHSAMGALVTSKVFKMRVVQAKKGKGSFNRKAKHSGKECYQIAA